MWGRLVGVPSGSGRLVIGLRRHAPRLQIIVSGFPSRRSCRKRACGARARGPPREHRTGPPRADVRAHRFQPGMARAPRGAAGDRRVLSHGGRLLLDDRRRCCGRRPGRSSLDSIAAENRPGRHGIWQRPVERRRLAQAPLLMTWSEHALDPLRRTACAGAARAAAGRPAPRARAEQRPGHRRRHLRRRSREAATAVRAARRGSAPAPTARRSSSPGSTASIRPPGVRSVGRVSPSGVPRAAAPRAGVRRGAASARTSGSPPSRRSPRDAVLVTTPSPGPYPGAGDRAHARSPVRRRGSRRRAADGARRRHGRIRRARPRMAGAVQHARGRPGRRGEVLPRLLAGWRAPAASEPTPNRLRPAREPVHPDLDPLSARPARVDSEPVAQRLLRRAAVLPRLRDHVRARGRGGDPHHPPALGGAGRRSGPRLRRREVGLPGRPDRRPASTSSSRRRRRCRRTGGGRSRSGRAAWGSGAGSRSASPPASSCCTGGSRESRSPLFMDCRRARRCSSRRRSAGSATTSTRSCSANRPRSRGALKISPAIPAARLSRSTRPSSRRSSTRSSGTWRSRRSSSGSATTAGSARPGCSRSTSPATRASGSSRRRCGSTTRSTSSGCA